jgi:nucleotide-binding universal stress UspA family protein
MSYSNRLHYRFMVRRLSSAQEGRALGLQHIVVAADETETSRNAIRTALGWADRAGARVTVLSVSQQRAMANGTGPAPALAAIGRWLAHEAPEWDASSPLLVEAAGVPSIEIARFAERAAADLLVVGRKSRSTTSRRLLGDTADAVARRSRVPCLFAPEPDPPPDRLLAALDGTDRGLTVLHAAAGLAAALGAALDLVTVEPASSDEPAHLAGDLSSGRTERLARTLGPSARELRVRRGAPVAEILREIDARRARVLVLGYHRGGPPGPVEAGSVARQLVHRAPCAVLTIPL